MKHSSAPMHWENWGELEVITFKILEKYGDETIRIEIPNLFEKNHSAEKRDADDYNNRSLLLQRHSERSREG